jgi:transcriptional regulator with XRE-family HTH domain
MKRAAERGRWGTWLRQERLRRNLSTEQVRDLLAKRGYRVGESTYAEWESGYKKQPAREAQPHLTALFESEPPPELEPASGAYDMPALFAKMDRQTDAIESVANALLELITRMDGAQSVAREEREQIAELLGVVARAQSPEEMPVASAPSRPGQRRR